MLKGWAAPEVTTSLQPALALAKSLGRHDELTPILLRLTFNVLSQGRVAEALPWTEETLDLAKATGDADLLITAHAVACANYCFAGEFIKSAEHADKVLDLYDPERHRHLADKTDRSQLRKALGQLDAGDELMLTRLDRLARSTRDLLNTLATITNKKAGFRSLGDTWADTASAHGRLMLTVLGGLAEFGRELIRAAPETAAPATRRAA
jgi:hypothetical protein